MMVKWAKLQLPYYKVPLTTGFQCKATLSNGPGYEVSSLLTSNLLIIPLKPDKL